MNLKLYVICITAMLALTAPSLADSNNTAKIRGEVYNWNTFEPLENAIVEVNSTPSQSMVAKYSVYSFELAPGNYSITAKYYQNSTLLYSGEEIVEIKDNGDYVKDLLLLPVYSEALMDSSEGNGSAGSFNTTNKAKSSDNASITSQENRVNSPTVSSLLIGFLLIALLAGGYQLSRKNKKAGKDELHRVSKEYISKEYLDKPIQYYSKPESSPEISEKVFNGTSEPEARQTIQESRHAGNEESINASIEKLVPTFQPETEPELKTPTTVSEHVTGKEQSEPELKTSLTTHTVEIEPGFVERKVLAEKKKDNLAQEEALAGSEEKSKLTALDPEGDLDRSENSPKIETPALQSEVTAYKKKLPLPADLQEVMDIIRGQGGRITQKDLRSKLKYSEGKVSLMIADLERRELLEKFKRGRGNVIILKDEER